MLSLQMVCAQGNAGPTIFLTAIQAQTAHPETIFSPLNYILTRTVSLVLYQALATYTWCFKNSIVNSQALLKTQRHLLMVTQPVSNGAGIRTQVCQTPNVHDLPRHSSFLPGDLPTHL